MPPEYNVTNTGETKDAFNSYQNSSFVSGDAHTSSSQSLTSITNSVVNYIAVMPSDSGRIQEGSPSGRSYLTAVAETDSLCPQSMAKRPFLRLSEAIIPGRTARRIVSKTFQVLYAPWRLTPTTAFQMMRSWQYSPSPRFRPLSLETIYDEPNSIAQQMMSPTSVENVQQCEYIRQHEKQLTCFLVPHGRYRTSDVEKGHRANTPLFSRLDTNAGDTIASGSSGYIQPSAFNSSSPAGPSRPTSPAAVSYTEVSTQQYVSSPNTPAKSVSSLFPILVLCGCWSADSRLS